MKYILCLFVLVELSYSVDRGHDPRQYWLGFEKGDLRKLDYDLQNPGIHDDRPTYYDRREDYKEHIVRPCRTHDLDCIRRVLAVTFGCTPVHGHIPDPYFVKKVPLHVPSSNASALLYHVQLKGLRSGEIKEFYINKKTDSLVLEVEFDTFVVSSPKSVAIFYRKGREPIEVTDFTEAKYNQLSFTLTIRHIHNMNLLNSNVFTYFTGLQLVVGPKMENAEGFASIRQNDIRLVGKEAMITQAPLYITLFIKNKLCDFGHH